MAVGSKSFVDMPRLKMGADPRKEAVAAMQEDTGKYGQDACDNMIEWEVFNSSDF
jgi:hypothetical protein